MYNACKNKGLVMQILVLVVWFLPQGRILRDFYSRSIYSGCCETEHDMAFSRSCHQV